MPEPQSTIEWFVREHSNWMCFCVVVISLGLSSALGRMFRKGGRDD